MKKPVVEYDLGYKKMPIGTAILLLKTMQGKGATHVRGIHIQWEVLKESLRADTRGEASNG